MIVYMLKDTKTGSFYKRGRNGGRWVSQDEATTWTNKRGPAAAKGHVKPATKKHLEIVSFKLIPNVQLALVTSDDWEGLYVGGELQYEGHHVHRDTLLQAAGLEMEVYDADDEWLADRGDLPAYLSDVWTQ